MEETDRLRVEMFGCELYCVHNMSEEGQKVQDQRNNNHTIISCIVLQILPLLVHMYGSHIRIRHTLHWKRTPQALL